MSGGSVQRGGLALNRTHSFTFTTSETLRVIAEDEGGQLLADVPFSVKSGSVTVEGLTDTMGAGVAENLPSAQAAIVTWGEDYELVRWLREDPAERHAVLREKPRLRLELSPSYLYAGETLTISVAEGHRGLASETVTIELLETSWNGEDEGVLARFQATMDGTGEAFSAIERELVHDDEEPTYEAPQPKADVSKANHTLPFQTTWRRSDVVVSLGPAEHRVLVQGAIETGEPGFRVRLAARAKRGEEELFVCEGEDQRPIHDSWGAFLHNCSAAAKTMLHGHHWLVATHGRGDYYGSACGVVPKNCQVTSCIGMVLQAMDRGFEELVGFTKRRRIMKGAAANGGVFAKKICKLGFELVFFLDDKPRHDAISRDERDAYWRIVERALTEDVFKTYGNSGGKTVVVANEPLAEAIHTYYAFAIEADGSWGEEVSDAAARARYDEFEALAPFAPIALSLGYHMGMKVGDRIFECHYGDSHTDSNLFDRSRRWDQPVDSYFYLAVPPGVMDASVPAGTTAARHRADCTPRWEQIAVWTGEWRPSDIDDEGFDDWGDESSGEGFDEWGEQDELELEPIEGGEGGEGGAEDPGGGGAPAPSEEPPPPPPTPPSEAGSGS